MAFPSGYTKYQEVVVDNTKVNTDLTDFVIYVNLADLLKAGADVFDSCRSDGGDIRVTKSDGTTELAREVVAIDTAAKTGELHVKFTGTLSSSSDTTIRIWYNGSDVEPAVTDTYGRNAVWSDYGLVYHNTTNIDSTGNNGAGTLGGSPTVGGVTGKIGKATDLNGSSQYIDYSSNSSFQPTTAFTTQFWANFDTTASPNNAVISHGGFTGRYDHWAETSKFRGASVVTGPTQDILTGTTTISAGTWYMSHYTYDNSNIRLYVGGAQEDSGALTGTLITGTNVRFGARATAVALLVNGKIDEIRIRLSTLSANWISTEYNNQNSPATFYSAGDEIISGGGGGGQNSNFLAIL